MRSNPDIDALVRQAEEAGGRVLRTVIPTPGPCEPEEGTYFPNEPGSLTPKPNKYGAKRTEYAGLRYDSKAEAAYASILDREAKVCPGLWWVRQVTFHLGVPENVYRCDFLVCSPEAPSPIRAVDVKGVRTAKFEHDVKLWRSYGPCPLVVVTRKRGQWYEEIIEGRNPNS